MVPAWRRGGRVSSSYASSFLLLRLPLDFGVDAAPPPSLLPAPGITLSFT